VALTSFISRLIPLLPALVLAACAVGDGPSSEPPGASDPAASEPTAPSAEPSADATVAFPIELIDDAGRTVLLEAPAERIVSLAPSNTEIVCALDACDRVVGVTDFDDYPPEVAEVTDVVIQTQVDTELVVEAAPDLVLAAGNELTPTAVIEQLTDLGLTVVVLYPESLDEVYGNIELVAAAIDAPDRAAALVASMEERVAAVEAAVAGAETPRTLYEVFHAEGTTYTAGEGSFLASLIEIAGGEAVTGDAQGVIDAESLVAADPELILLGGASYDPTLADPAAALDAVAARPGWAEVTAVSSGAVEPYLDDIVTTRPGPRIVDGLEALARAIHPELFE
jgi:iron complex transport system substrate-binding protein